MDPCDISLKLWNRTTKVITYFKYENWNIKNNQNIDSIKY